MIINGFGAGGQNASDDNTWFVITNVTVSNYILNTSNFSKSTTLTIGTGAYDYNAVENASMIKVRINSFSLSGTGVYSTSSNSGWTAFGARISGSSITDDIYTRSCPAPGNTTATSMASAFYYLRNNWTLYKNSVFNNTSTTLYSGSGPALSTDVTYWVFSQQVNTSSSVTPRYILRNNLASNQAAFQIIGYQSSDCYVPSGNWYLSFNIDLVGHY